MTTPNLSLAHLEHLLALTKKKLALSLDLEKIEQRIAEFFGGHQPEPAPVSKTKTPTRRRGRGRRKSKPAEIEATPGTPSMSRRGGVTEKIIAILEAAGDEGISVNEVAEKLGSKRNSVQVWFSSTGKKFPEIKKLAPGRFGLVKDGAKPSSILKPPTAKIKSPRGTQKERILAVLGEAGGAGLSVAEVAEKIGAKAKNINPWFYTAGKKAGVKKVARGRFVFTGKNANAAPAEVAKASTKRGRPAKKAAPIKSTKATVKSPRKTKRGTLKPRILAALQEAGADGLSVGEVAEKIGAKKKNINPWFYTAGKKAGVKKVARGRFALKGDY